MKIRYTNRVKLVEKLAVELVRLVFPRATTADIYFWRNETVISSYVDVGEAGRGRAAFVVSFWVDDDKDKPIFANIPLRLDSEGEWVFDETINSYVYVMRNGRFVFTCHFKFEDGEFIIFDKSGDFTY